MEIFTATETIVKELYAPIEIYSKSKVVYCRGGIPRQIPPPLKNLKNTDMEAAINAHSSIIIMQRKF